MSEDYYALLGVDPEASEEAILQAYREKAAEHHPDVSAAADAETTFRRLNRAKDVLTDADRRRKYDRIGHDRFVEQTDTDQGSDRTPVNVQRGTERKGTNPEWPSGFGSLLERLFGGGGQWTVSTSDQRRRHPWNDRRTASTINLESHLNDWSTATPSNHANQRTNLGSSGDSQDSSCPKCRGRGSFVHEIDTARGVTRRIEPCERCQGSGSVPE